jgi:hypothetical protein
MQFIFVDHHESVLFCPTFSSKLETGKSRMIKFLQRLFTCADADTGALGPTAQARAAEVIFNIEERARIPRLGFDQQPCQSPPQPDFFFAFANGQYNIQQNAFVSCNEQKQEEQEEQQARETRENIN